MQIKREWNKICNHYAKRCNLECGPAQWCRPVHGRRLKRRLVNRYCIVGANRQSRPWQHMVAQCHAAFDSGNVSATAEIYPLQRNCIWPKCALSSLRKNLERFAKKSGEPALFFWKPKIFSEFFRLSEKFSDFLKIFQIIWKIFRLSEIFSENLKNSQIIWNIFR